MSNIPVDKKDFSKPLNYDGKYLKPFFWWSSHVLPTVYENSLSYYEVLDKIMYKLIEVFKDVNALGDDVEALHEAYTLLQDEYWKFKEALIKDNDEFKDNINKAWALFQTTIQNELDKWKEDTTNDLDAYKQALTLAWDTFRNSVLTDWANYQNTINSEWENYQTTMNKWKDDTDKKFEAEYQALIDFQNDLTQQWNTEKQSLESWKTQSDADIKAKLEELTTLKTTLEQWKQETDTAFNQYKTNLTAEWTTFENQIKSDWENYQTTLTGQWNNYQTKLNQEWEEYKTSVDNQLDTVKNAPLDRQITVEWLFDTFNYNPTRRELTLTFPSDVNPVPDTNVVIIHAVSNSVNAPAVNTCTVTLQSLFSLGAFANHTETSENNTHTYTFTNDVSSEKIVYNYADNTLSAIGDSTLSNNSPVIMSITNDKPFFWGLTYIPDLEPIETDLNEFDSRITENSNDINRLYNLKVLVTPAIIKRLTSTKYAISNVHYSALIEIVTEKDIYEITGSQINAISDEVTCTRDTDNYTVTLSGPPNSYITYNLTTHRLGLQAINTTLDKNVIPIYYFGPSVDLWQSGFIDNINHFALPKNTEPYAVTLNPKIIGKTSKTEYKLKSSMNNEPVLYFCGTETSAVSASKLATIPEVQCSLTDTTLTITGPANHYICISYADYSLSLQPVGPLPAVMAPIYYFSPAYGFDRFLTTGVSYVDTFDPTELEEQITDLNTNVSQLTETTQNNAENIITINEKITQLENEAKIPDSFTVQSLVTSEHIKHTAPDTIEIIFPKIWGSWLFEYMCKQGSGSISDDAVMRALSTLPTDKFKFTSTESSVNQVPTTKITMQFLDVDNGGFMLYLEKSETSTIIPNYLLKAREILGGDAYTVNYPIMICRRWALPDRFVVSIANSFVSQIFQI